MKHLLLRRLQPLAGPVALAVLLGTAAASLLSLHGPAAAQSAIETSGDGSKTWAALTPAQRAALAPLQEDWDRLAPIRRQKWLDIAARYPRMSEGDRARLQNRMADWARLSPEQRGQARLRFQQAQKLSPEERQARWDEYQALPADQRRELATQAARPPAGRDRKAAAGPKAKQNLVPNPLYSPQPVAVGPAVVRAQPGATTNLISEPKLPPTHQQTGLPKITATPGFIDRATLLPQRGPQAAAAVKPGPVERRDGDARQP